MYIYIYIYIYIYVCVCVCVCVCSSSLRSRKSALSSSRRGVVPTATVRVSNLNGVLALHDIAITNMIRHIF